METKSEFSKGGEQSETKQSETMTSPPKEEVVSLVVSREKNVLEKFFFFQSTICSSFPRYIIVPPS